MKRSGVILVTFGAAIGIVCGVLVVLAGIGDLRSGKALGGQVLSIGSSAIVLSLAFLAILATRAKHHARNCGALLIVASLVIALLGFAVIVGLVLALPSMLSEDYSVFTGTIFLVSWFVSVFVAFVLIGGVLIRVGAADADRADLHAYR